MDRFSPTPIEPDEPARAEAAQLSDEWLDAPVRARVFLCVLTGLAGIGCLYAGFAISRDSPGWVAWLLTILILEPLGVACLLGLLVLAAPNSFLATLLSGSLRRARLVLILIGIAFGLGVLLGFAFVGRELWGVR